VDEDDGVSEKKLNRGKKTTSHQQSIDRADSKIDDLITVPSITTMNTETHQLSTSHNLDQFAPLISV